MTLAPEKTLKEVVTDFLGSAPTLEEIAAYRLPDSLQIWAHDLLDKNREDTLSDDERRQMEEFLQIDNLLSLVKVKAWLKLTGKPTRI